MNNVILTINAGSSSIKFVLFSLHGDELQLRYRGAIEAIGLEARLVVEYDAIGLSVSSKNTAINAESHEAALQYLLTWLAQLPSQFNVVAVGHRVVHGGVYFNRAVKVDATVLAQLQQLIPLAPLHQPQALRAIEHLSKQRPMLVQIAYFDTAFHTTMPSVEQHFALPRALFDQGVRRYGFHGISYEYIASVLPQRLNQHAYGRVVVAHLGHGASMCALKDGKSIATTMSFTPLDGLPMASRCGAIDAAVVLYLMREHGMSVDEVSELLHSQSGLFGLSGISGDMRTLLANESAAAIEAVAFFVHRVGRELGALVASLGGIDALVFTGGIGEHAASIRAMICQQAAWLGLALDVGSNERHASRISLESSAVSAWIIPTDEAVVIAQRCVAVLRE